MFSIIETVQVTRLGNIVSKDKKNQQLEECKWIGLGREGGK